MLQMFVSHGTEPPKEKLELLLSLNGADVRLMVHSSCRLYMRLILFISSASMQKTQAWSLVPRVARRPSPVAASVLTSSGHSTPSVKMLFFLLRHMP